MALDAILDTRFIFSLLAPESREVANWTRSIVLKTRDGKLKIGCSVISATEFYHATACSLKQEEAAVRLHSLEASKIRFLDVDREIAEAAGIISRTSPRLPTGDALIAATGVLRARGKILTDDPHFKMIKGIKPFWLTGP